MDAANIKLIPTCSQFRQIDSLSPIQQDSVFTTLRCLRLLYSYSSHDSQILSTAQAEVDSIRKSHQLAIRQCLRQCHTSRNRTCALSKIRQYWTLLSHSHIYISCLISCICNSQCQVFAQCLGLCQWQHVPSSIACINI